MISISGATTARIDEISSGEHTIAFAPAFTESVAKATALSRALLA
jgi:hypothetical protein